MKKTKKVFSFFLAAFLILCAVCPAAAAAEKAEPKFGEDGKFRILHITDTHYTDHPFEESRAFLEKVLDEYTPQLVIFGGDNIKGWFDTSVQLGVKAAIDALVAPLEERDIPFSYTYGNHDWEAYLCPKVIQNGMYEAHSNCIEPEKHGITGRAGDGYIQIKDSSGTKNILNIWLFDSGTKTKTGKTHVESVNSVQLRWYEKTNAFLRDKNGGEPIKSLVFQHFPVWEITKIFDEDENGVSCGDKKYVLKNEFTDGVTAGMFGRPNDRITTHLNKTAELPSENSGEYDVLVNQGDVIGAFFGHSHVNDYCGITEDGILLGSTMSAGGFNISSRFNDKNGEPVEARGVRVIELDEKVLLDKSAAPTDSITTFSVYYSDYFDGSIEKYPSKYKEYDEHDFGEWMKIEFGYLVKLFKEFLHIH